MAAWRLASSVSCGCFSNSCCASKLEEQEVVYFDLDDSQLIDWYIGLVLSINLDLIGQSNRA